MHLKLIAFIPKSEFGPAELTIRNQSFTFFGLIPTTSVIEHYLLLCGSWYRTDGKSSLYVPHSDVSQQLIVIHKDIINELNLLKE